MRARIGAGLVTYLLFVMVGCGGGGSTPGDTAEQPAITQQPADLSVIVGQPATFSVSASGAAPLSYQWQKNGTAISGATSSSYTTPATAMSDNHAQFAVAVSNSLGNVTSRNATLTVSASPVNVTTYHNDNARTGQNLNETILTPANVNSNTFGKIGEYAVDGRVDAEPLYLSSISIPGQGTHNLLYVVTEHDSVYAFDADTGAVIWHVSTLKSGEVPSGDHGCGQVSPEIGITSTPVIDQSRGPNGAIYVVAMAKTSSGTYVHRLHALDLTTGGEVFGGPKDIQATYPGTGDNSSGGNVIFDPGQYKERPGLLMLNGVLYTSWASHCDFRPYTGWIMAHDPNTLAQTAILNITPNGSGGAIWMSGGALAADNSAIYFLAANGEFDTNLNAQGFPNNGDYGNAFMKLTASSGLGVADYFEMDNQQGENNGDVDLGSGSAMVLPDVKDNSNKTWHLAVGAGKDGNLYVVNRDSMGKFNANNNNIYQELQGGVSGGIWGAPAYFNNTVYFGPVGGSIQAFTINNAKLSPVGQTGTHFGYPGTTPSVSANGTTNAILWAVENAGTGVLHAYDANDLSNELYNSNQAGSRDHFSDNKFVTPMIANGKVFVGTTNSIAVFGLLP